MAIGPFMNKTVTTQRGTVTNSGRGATVSFSQQLSALKCALSEKSEAIIVQGQGVVLSRRMVMIFDANQDVLTEDRVIDGSVTYRITGVTDLGGRGVFAQADLEKLRSGET